jgi:alkylation response protein AidB-like acyl-CoA dehydrogenase
MYHAPVRELRFVLDEIVGATDLVRLFENVDYSCDLAGSVLEEASKFAESVLEPINRSGDAEGAHWTAQGVTTPAGFPQAYAGYVAGGWSQLAVPVADGGQGMPLALCTAVEEIWFGANLAFSLGPSLTRGAIEAIQYCGTAQQKALLLPKLVSGAWTGTMNLTESQAGSDLAQIRTRAVAEGDHYRIFGQKIFISFGDHDLTENILHLVLARVDGSPPGVRGISMFFVPKFLPNADGSSGEPNDLRCLSIEHKLGIHGSPTCVMSFGERAGAFGWLAGEVNSGLEYMFVMMNAARISVGVQAIALSERAFQQALDWAHNRIQGRPPGAAGVTAGSAALPIIHHPDVKRMLLLMKARTEAMRALALYAAFELDKARVEPDAARRAAALARGELLIPIVKGWSTESGTDIASMGVQVHGGMGFIEETGAAQTLRDVRITSIYEGTTAIQANDLIGRKLGRDRGAALTALVQDLLLQLNGLRAVETTPRMVKNAAMEALTLLRDTAESLLHAHQQDPARSLAVAVPFLNLCGTVFGGALVAKSAAIAAAKLASATGADAQFYKSKLQTARFYAEQILTDAFALARVVKSGAGSVVDADVAVI